MCGDRAWLRRAYIYCSLVICLSACLEMGTYNLNWQLVIYHYCDIKVPICYFRRSYNPSPPQTLGTTTGLRSWHSTVISHDLSTTVYVSSKQLGSTAWESGSSTASSGSTAQSCAPCSPILRRPSSSHVVACAPLDPQTAIDGAPCSGRRSVRTMRRHPP